MYWIDIFQLDTEVRFTVWDADGPSVEVIQVDDEFAASMLASYETLTGAGDRVTVLREHEHDGFHYGSVHGLRIDEQPDGRWMQAQVSFVPEVESAWRGKKVKEFSPGFARQLIDPHTGEEHENVLLEVSFTSMALQHTLRPPEQTAMAASLLGNLMAKQKPTHVAQATGEEVLEEAPPVSEDPPDLAVALADLQMVVAQLTDRVAALEGGGEEMEPEAEADAEVDEVTASLQQRIVQLEDEVARAELRPLGLTEQEREHLVQLRRVSPELYAAHRARVSATASAQPAPAQPIGVTGQADTTPRSTITPPDKIHEWASSQGLKWGTAQFSLRVAEKFGAESLAQLRAERVRS